VIWGGGGFCMRGDIPRCFDTLRNLCETTPSGQAALRTFQWDSKTRLGKVLLLTLSARKSCPLPGFLRVFSTQDDG
jgi:hypothetical protein